MGMSACHSSTYLHSQICSPVPHGGRVRCVWFSLAVSAVTRTIARVRIVAWISANDKERDGTMSQSYRHRRRARAMNDNRDGLHPVARFLLWPLLPLIGFVISRAVRLPRDYGP